MPHPNPWNVPHMREAILAGIQRRNALYRAGLAQRIEDRSFPEPNSGCFLWTGWSDPKGYGRLHIARNRSIMATRVVYALHIGPVPDDMHVCHRCDFPPCVNPAHLFLGSIKENMADKMAKNRQARGAKLGATLPKGGDVHSAKLTSEQVILIRADARNQRTVAGQYGVSQSAVSRIRSGKNWAHL